MVGSPDYPKLPSSRTTGLWVINLPANGTEKGSVNIVSFTLELKNFTGKSRYAYPE